MLRPLTRLRLLLPPGRDADVRTPSTVETIAGRIADALAVHGVQVRQQVRGAPFDGAPRADVALWFPDETGAVPAPDPRAAPARVHAALVVEPSAGGKNLSRYDALVVPHPSLRDPVRAAQKKAAHAGREIPVVVARLAGAPPAAREAEKALRGVAGRLVVVVDVRGKEGGARGSGLDFEADIERVVVQLALQAQAAAVVLLAPHEERARARVRALCARHGVDAWLASGAEAFAQSVGAADLVVGCPAWHEILLTALTRTAVSLLPFEGPHAIVDGLLAARAVDDVMGVLQLAAALDRRLADPGALEAKGIALREALFGADKDLADALAALEPLPQGAHLQSAWEPVGPQAAQPGQGGGPVVDARDAGAPAEPSRGQKIEDALEALKARIGKAE